MQKVCCIGTHGSGKTTLSYQQAAYYKTNGKNVKLVHETARSCPFPINQKFNAYGAMWIVHTHIKKELEAMFHNADIVICDRSPIDSMMYALATGCIVGLQMKNLYKMCEDWMDTYDKIYYVRPDGHDIIPDGIRSTDESFCKKVEGHFDDWMEKSNLAVQAKTIVINSSRIFSECECWQNERIV